MRNTDHTKFMNEAISLSAEGMHNNFGGPFGAVIVRNGQIVGRGNNNVTKNNDPTAHAEVNAIRDACENLGTFQLTDCELYTSCEPCPMCLGAIYWARLKKVFYACTREDAAKIGFDDEFIYTEIEKPMAERNIPMVQMNREEAHRVFEKWTKKGDKTVY